MSSGYKPIDMSIWPRTPYYNYYAHGSKGMCAITADIDITSLYSMIQKQSKDLYITMIYLTTLVINKHEEFRVGYCKDNGELMIWDSLEPIYRIFHEEDETFTRIFTPWNKDFNAFYKSVTDDMEKGKSLKGLNGPNLPDNAYESSYVPWIHYSSVNIKMSESGKHLAPIVTVGTADEKDGKVSIPLTMQISHAVADGFHIARFFKEVKDEAEKLAKSL